jgi:hypothetical protein
LPDTGADAVLSTMRVPPVVEVSDTTVVDACVTRGAVVRGVAGTVDPFGGGGVTAAGAVVAGGARRAVTGGVVGGPVVRRGVVVVVVATAPDGRTPGFA